MAYINGNEVLFSAEVYEGTNISIDVVQTTGDSETAVMSQKAVTENLAKFGLESVKFTVPAGEAHSSTKDRVNINIKLGETYYVEVKCSLEKSEFSCFEIGENGDSSENKGTDGNLRLINKVIPFTATKNITAIGVYIGTKDTNVDYEVIVHKSNSVLLKPKLTTEYYAYLDSNTAFDYSGNTLIFNEDLNIVYGTEKLVKFYMPNIETVATAAGFTTNTDNGGVTVTGSNKFVFYFDIDTENIGFFNGDIVDNSNKLTLFSYSWGTCFGLLVDLYNSQRSRKVDAIEAQVNPIETNQSENPQRYGYGYNAYFNAVKGSLSPDDGSEIADNESSPRMRSGFVTILKPAYFEVTAEIRVRQLKYSLNEEFISAEAWTNDKGVKRWLEGGYKYRFIFCDKGWQMPSKNLIAQNVKLYIDGKDDVAYCSDYLLNEVMDTATKAEAEQELSFSFAMLTDAHNSHSLNFTNWEDTVRSIGNVNSIYPLDAIFSLGDQIEGDRPISESKEMLKRMRNDLLNISAYSFMLTGNHDTNDYYDRTNHTERLSVADRYSLYARYANSKVARNGISNYGYYDINSLKIRVIMLDNLESDTVLGDDMAAMGYSTEQVAWVRDVALDTEYQVIFFAHTGVTKEFNYNAVQPANGVELRTVIESFIANGGVVIGMFHGHTHWDYIGKYSASNGFYEISTASANWYKASSSAARPDGAVIPTRTNGTATQELWDLVIVKPISRTVKLIRFGAGEDRSFSY